MLDIWLSQPIVLEHTSCAVLVRYKKFVQVAVQIIRLYYSITVGVPDRKSGEICTNIDRHPTDRLRMAVYGFGSTRGRQAISTYRCAPFAAGHLSQAGSSPGPCSASMTPGPALAVCSRLAHVSVYSQRL